MDNFREEVAAKRNRTWSLMLYGFSWAVIVLSGLIAMMNFSTLMSGYFSWEPVVYTVLFAGLAFLIWRKKDNLRIEYDYTFTNGDLDIAKVFGNSRRRLMTSLPMKNVESAGAVTHPSFQRFLQMKDCKKHNWFVNRDAHLYYFYFIKKEIKHVVIVELSDEMIVMLKPYLGFGIWNE